MRHAGVAKAMAGTKLGLDDLAHHVGLRRRAAAGARQRSAGLPADLRRHAPSRCSPPPPTAPWRPAACAWPSATPPARSTCSTRRAADDERVAHLRRVRAAAEHRPAPASTPPPPTSMRCRRSPSGTDDMTMQAEAHRLRGMLANVAGDVGRGHGSELGRRGRSAAPGRAPRPAGERAAPVAASSRCSPVRWPTPSGSSARPTSCSASSATNAAWPTSSSTAPGSRSCPATSKLARERLTHAAGTHDQLGDRNGVGWAFGLLAFVEFFERHFDEAENARRRRCSREAELRGDEWAAGMMDTLRADLRLWQGELEEAHDLAEQARNAVQDVSTTGSASSRRWPRWCAPRSRSAGSPPSQRSSEELIALAETGTQGPFPLMAVAGAAMHRGNGIGRRVAMAERTIEEMRSNGGERVRARRAARRRAGPAGPDRRGARGHRVRAGPRGRPPVHPRRGGAGAHGRRARRGRASSTPTR